MRWSCSSLSNGAGVPEATVPLILGHVDGVKTEGGGGIGGKLGVPLRLRGRLPVPGLVVACCS